MPYVIAAPDMLAAAASDVAGIGSSLRAAHVAATASTTGVVAAAEDEVSAGVAALFSSYGQKFQAVSAQAAAFHDGFVNLLSGGAAQYLNTEVANAQQTLVNAPAQAVLVGAGQNSAAIGFGGFLTAAKIIWSESPAGAAVNAAIEKAAGSFFGKYGSIYIGSDGNGGYEAKGYFSFNHPATRFSVDGLVDINPTTGFTHSTLFDIFVSRPTPFGAPIDFGVSKGPGSSQIQGFFNSPSPLGNINIGGGTGGNTGYNPGGNTYTTYYHPTDLWDPNVPFPANPTVGTTYVDPLGHTWTFVDITGTNAVGPFTWLEWYNMESGQYAALSYTETY